MGEELTEEELVAVEKIGLRLGVHDEGFEKQMLEDVAFSPEDIDTAMIEQASLYAFYAEQSRVATKTADNLKLKISVVEAEVDKEIRDEAATDGKKITEKAIDKEIVRHAKYVKACMAHNSAKAIAQLIRDVLESFKHRRDCLIQIGVSKREEQKGRTFVNTAEHAASMQERREALSGKKAA